MDKERMEYFFTVLDAHLISGKSPAISLLRATEDYAYVWFSDGDGKLPINRASEIALRDLREHDKEHDQDG